MTGPFPKTVTFSGYDAPSRIEADVYDLEIEGELPRSIRGDWFRVGPDPQYPPHRGDDVFINGDGMVSAFRFADGHVDFSQRFVRTERFVAERKARRSLFGEYRNRWTDHDSVRGLGRGTANTNALWHGGKLLILKEDSLPYELDPDTLATRGPYDWGGKLRSRTVSAHPKIDARTGELHFYGYEATGEVGPEMAYCVADASGALVREEWFDAPYVAMVHDFAITPRYAIFPLFPTIADEARMKAGGPHWMTDLTKESYIGVLPRNGTAKDLRWFRHPGCHAFHVINAYEEGEQIHLDMSVAQINPFPYIPDVSGAEFNPRGAAPVPMRWTLDLAGRSDAVSARPLVQGSGDMPRIDDRFYGLPYQHAYLCMVEPTRPILKAGPVAVAFNTVARLDVQTGAVHGYHAERTSFQEPQFIPGGSAEGDGHVVCVFDRHDENRSDIGVFDAGRMAAGPVALIRVPLRLRTAFHGTWKGAD